MIKYTGKLFFLVFALLHFIDLSAIEKGISAAKYTVTLTTDSLANSGEGMEGELRWAINKVNKVFAENNIINFSSATKPMIINLTKDLPDITASVTIDGYSNGMGTPNTALTGNNASLSVVVVGKNTSTRGFNFTAASSGSVIRGLVLYGFYSGAITLSSTSYIRIDGNFLGTDHTGLTLASKPNQYGIVISNSSNITIGGKKSQRNVIAGSDVGIYGANVATSSITSNYIGTDKTGTTALPNSMGIFYNKGSSLSIGGADAEYRNLISGNARYGINIQTVTGCSIIGNYIGTDVSGTKVLANTGEGIVLSSVTNGILGGNSSLHTNLISGNSFDGISMSLCQTCTLQGNHIGTDLAGTTALGNKKNGLKIDDCHFVTVGGSDAGAKNLISGNLQSGINILNGSTHTIIAGNFIGTNKDGTAALPNSSGIVQRDGSHTLIGKAKNLISGNTYAGIDFFNVVASSIRGNYIGTNHDGSLALANVFGIAQSENALATLGENSIGGTNAADRNIIAGNTEFGIWVADTKNISLLIQGNYIGTNAQGTAAIPNKKGIAIENSLAASTISRANLISGNVRGISIHDSLLTTIKGNYIGTNYLGSSALPNAYGIYLYSCDGLHTIGGVEAQDRNVISGNSVEGLSIRACSNCFVEGNYIGINAAGDAAVPNKIGVRVQDCQSQNMIGGFEVARRNIISGNTEVGVSLHQARNCLLERNYIGTNPAGTSAIPNGIGVYLRRSTYGVIGGSSAVLNVISGNDVGVQFQNAFENMLSYNYIGLDASGTKNIKNVSGNVVYLGDNTSAETNEVNNNKYGA